MDIRKVFIAASEHLLIEFRRSAEVRHGGGRGSIREDALATFLKEYLPTRYGVGRGEVVTSENRQSGQLDVVVYDPSHCPVLLTSSSHSIYPIESVYGAISVKSKLSSKELKDAYKNIQTLKEIVPTEGFQLKKQPGMLTGMAAPVPVTAVVAYDADRSLEAIAAQAESLDNDLADIKLRPDFIAVVGKGIIGPRTTLRSEFNRYAFPAQNELIQIRKSGRHTLLRLYMQILQELNALTLRDLNLHDYDRMPRLVGSYRVGHDDRFAMKLPDDTETRDPSVYRLIEKAIRLIINGSEKVTLQQHLLNTIGTVPSGAEQIYDLNSCVYEYNPNKRRALTATDIIFDCDNNPSVGALVFRPLTITIDKSWYAVDIQALSSDCFEDEPDFNVDELLSY